MADLPCPSCGSTLAFLEQYHRYYCLHCGQYAPEGYGDRGARHCPTCGGILSFVTQYNRYYCYRCSLYAPEEAIAAAGKPAATPSPSPTSLEPKAEPAPSASAAQVTASVPVPPTPASEATMIATATPTPAAPAESKPAETTASAPPQVDSNPAPSQAPATETPAPAPAEAASSAPPVAAPVEGPSPEMRRLSESKPAVVRVKIFTLKKAELIDLCKAYDLDPSGTKEQVQERLLSYLHDLEADETDQAGEPAATPEPTPAAIVTPAPQVETRSEPVAGSHADVATPAAAAAMIQVERPVAPSVVTVQEAPAAQPESVVVETARVVPRIEHPCPTCGRELTFIAQYGRYYCYFCQRYAPATRAKGACPTCGTSMRWIDQHSRWWCDSCQKYASADLPGPVRQAAVASQAAPATANAAATAPVVRPVVVHRHANPAAGIGLVGMGLALWIIVEFFTVLAPAMGLAINNPFTDGLAGVIVFFAFVFVAGGIMLGLSSLRDRI